MEEKAVLETTEKRQQRIGHRVWKAG